MPRGRGRSSGMGELVQGLGEQIGAELGRVIAQAVQRTLSNSLDVKDLARQLSSGRRGRRTSGGKGACTEPGCGNPVLAKGLCRSHYYRARYRAQKAGRGRKEEAT